MINIQIYKRVFANSNFKPIECLAFFAFDKVVEITFYIVFHLIKIFLKY